MGVNSVKGERQNGAFLSSGSNNPESRNLQRFFGGIGMHVALDFRAHMLAFCHHRRLIGGDELRQIGRQIDPTGFRIDDFRRRLLEIDDVVKDQVMDRANATAIREAVRAMLAGDRVVITYVPAEPATEAA